jgi:hypothetical protein
MQIESGRTVPLRKTDVSLTFKFLFILAYVLIWSHHDDFKRDELDMQPWSWSHHDDLKRMRKT